jgi:hypothetical protein
MVNVDATRFAVRCVTFAGGPKMVSAVRVNMKAVESVERFVAAVDYRR